MILAGSRAAALALCLLAGPLGAAQTLVSVDGQPITREQLQRTLASSPFASGYNTLEPQDQSALRATLLQGLVNAELLRLQARELGLHRSQAYERELAHYREGLLQQRYLQRLRDQVEPPPEQEQRLRRIYTDSPEALQAARSAWVASRYKARLRSTLRTLRRPVRVYEERLQSASEPEAVLAQGGGITVRLSDLPPARSGQSRRSRLEQVIESRMLAQAARELGIQVEDQVQAFARDLLPRLLLQELESEWIAGEAALRRYLAEHPELGRVPERRHIAQIVVSSPEKARALRRRIRQGESLFRLASEHSVDPYGRRNAGDMGWLAAGSGAPALEQALSELAERELSPVIRTPLGYHLVMILERRPARQKPFDAIRDRVKRALLQERLNPYLQALARRHDVQWHKPGLNGAPTPAVSTAP